MLGGTADRRFYTGRFKKVEITAQITLSILIKWLSALYNVDTFVTLI
jgi:hypothetical protein